jgi:hypothetical protein
MSMLTDLQIVLLAIAKTFLYEMVLVFLVIFMLGS